MKQRKTNKTVMMILNGKINVRSPDISALYIRVKLALFCVVMRCTAQGRCLL